MSVKMRKFLAAKREKARSENRLADWAWVGDCWRPIKKYRIIKRGRKKGQLKVELYYPVGKKYIVLARHIRYKEIDYAERAYEAGKRK